MSIHDDQPVYSAHYALDNAEAAVIVIHGRGSTAQSMLAIYEYLPHRADHKLSYIAPQAAGNSWYPFSFLYPLEQNEPYLSSALATIANLVAKVESVGIPSEKIAILGFSQGACLALEYAARHAKRYGAVIGYSGGLIGADGTPRDYAGSLAGTPVFLGCSNVDFHIPEKRVLESADILRGLGGNVDVRIYPNMGHTINDEEYAVGTQLLLDMLNAGKT
jgi:predicted esterase